LLQLGSDEETEGFLIHDGLSVRLGETSQIHRGLDVQRTSTRKAKVQAGPGYTRFKLDDAKDLADALMWRGLRVAVATRLLGVCSTSLAFQTALAFPDREASCTRAGARGGGVRSSRRSGWSPRTVGGGGSAWRSRLPERRAPAYFRPSTELDDGLQFPVGPRLADAALSSTPAVMRRGPIHI
jgi:hypothetical protein